MCKAERSLLVQDADSAVRRAVKRQWNNWIVDSSLLAIADADEPRCIRRLLEVQAKIALVRVIGERHFLGVVRRRQSGGGHAGDWQRTGKRLVVADDFRRKRVNGGCWNRGAGRVCHPGNWILHRHNQDAVDLVLRGQGVHVERTQRLAESLVVQEEE